MQHLLRNKAAASALLVIILLIFLIGMPLLSTQRAQQNSEEADNMQSYERPQCNFLPPPPSDDGQSAPLPSGSPLENLIRTGTVGMSGSSNSHATGEVLYCDDEVTSHPDGGYSVVRKEILCGQCVPVLEETYRITNTSRSDPPELFKERESVWIWECFGDDTVPANDSGTMWDNYHPAYPVQLLDTVYHDSTAWLCCDGDQYAEEGGDFHEILEQEVHFFWCIGPVENENEEDLRGVYLSRTDTIRKENWCRDAEGVTRPCEQADVAGCHGDIELEPRECLPEQESLSEGFCYFEQEYYGDCPNAERTLHLFAFDGFQNPGVNNEWAQTIGNVREVNSNVDINWHLFTQNKVDRALQRLIALHSQNPADYFGVAGFSWGGHSAIKLANRASDRGINLNLGFSCDAVPHRLTGGLSRPESVELWWNCYQRVDAPMGRSVAGADIDDNLSEIYSEYINPHMKLGRNCDNGKNPSHVNLELLIDEFLQGLQ